MSTSLVMHKRGLGVSDPEVTLVRIPLSLYPDNSPVLNMEKGIGNLGDYAVRGMLVKYTTYQDFVASMNFAYSLNRWPQFYSLDTLYLPYVPGARQDRPKHPNRTWDDQSTGDVLATLEFTVQLVKMAGFRKVVVVDPHSVAAKRAFDKAGIEFEDETDTVYDHAVGYIGSSIDGEYDGIISPDNGAVDRALFMAKEFNKPLLFGSKVRNQQTNTLSGFHVSGLDKGRHYLVVDDICDGGGTFMGLAEKIHEAGATADLYVTHGLFTKGASGKLKDFYKRIFTTDSLGVDADAVQQIPAVEYTLFPNLADHIYMKEGKR